MKKFLAAGAVALAALTLTTGTASAGVGQSITDIALANADFSTLAAAVGAAGLADTLDNCEEGAPQYTIFAPTNAAFDALPAGTVEALLADIPALTDVLLYHAVSGAVDSTAVLGLDGQMVTTLNGDDILVTVGAGPSVTLTDGQGRAVNVVISEGTINIPACNGIIHVIDAVLLPPTDEDVTMPGTGSNLTMTFIALGLLAMGSVIVLGARRRATV
ncbi:MAG: fasciclin domain-containing protein [Ilumatobacteraceae bacterium]